MISARASGRGMRGTDKEKGEAAGGEEIGEYAARYRRWNVVSLPPSAGNRHEFPSPLNACARICFATGVPVPVSPLISDIDSRWERISFTPLRLRLRT